jgi:hypothetical protein
MSRIAGLNSVGSSVSEQPSCATSSELPSLAARSLSRHTPSPQLQAVTCTWNVLSAQSSYQSRSLEVHAHLEAFDSDFGAFQKPTKKLPASVSDFKGPWKGNWLSADGGLAQPGSHGCR